MAAGTLVDASPWTWMAGLALVAAIVLASWLLPGFRAGVWSPTPRDVVETMLRLAGPRAGEQLVDLGYGDGRVLLAAARRYGVRATGYEINPFWQAWVGLQVWWIAIRDPGLRGRIRLLRADLFTADLSEADIVVAFLSQAAHDRLGPRLQAMLRPGARVVTYQRTFPGWPPAHAVEVRPGKFVFLFLKERKGQGA